MGTRRVLCCCLLNLLLVPALTAAPAAAEPLFPPGGFRLSASNGYNIHVLAFDGDPHGAHDEVILFVNRKNASVVYFALKRVDVTETTIAADLGRVGSIDLQFVPTGMPKEESSACDPRPIKFDSGFYEGKFDFKGEEGYAKAHVTRAHGEVRFAASLICGRSRDEGIGGGSPGARLVTRRHWDSGKLEFEATKNSPSRPSRFQASIEERRAGLVIDRGVSASAGAGAFDFDVPAQTALLAPPTPFHGTARFHHTTRRPGRLAGSLSVDFPGRSHVRLGGSSGGLVRWVQNPSHPFRLFVHTGGEILPQLHLCPYGPQMRHARLSSGGDCL
jgi:hypothetical protein